MKDIWNVPKNEMSDKHKASARINWQTCLILEKLLKLEKKCTVHCVRL